MEHHELITKAKEHVALVAPLDNNALSATDFRRVRVREVAMVCLKTTSEKTGFMFSWTDTGDFVVFKKQTIATSRNANASKIRGDKALLSSGATRATCSFAFVMSS